jgi:hypothetical protein
MVVLLKPFAGVGVAYAHHEEAEAEGQHDNVEHERLLCAAIRGTREELPSRFCRVERCHPAHRFSRRENQQRYRNLIGVVVAAKPSGPASGRADDWLRASWGDQSLFRFDGIETGLWILDLTRFLDANR